MNNRIATWVPPRPTQWQQFRREPAPFIARLLHHNKPYHNSRLPSSIRSSTAITVVCISDTHCTEPEVPDGDLLLHAGDLSNSGTFEELQDQLDWLASLPHKHKVVIAGNHDRLLDTDFVARFPERICGTEGKARADLEWHDVIYLHNSSTVLKFPNGRTLNIFGSPSTPDCGVFAFQYPPIRDVWTGAVPQGTDVLLTHGPPKGYLDLGGKGCPNLTREIARARPRVVVFGHIHAGRGCEMVDFGKMDTQYQRIMAGDGGLPAALGMILWWTLAWMMKLFHVISRGRLSQRDNAQTTMVSAAVAGGQHGELRSGTIIEI